MAKYFTSFSIILMILQFYKCVSDHFTVAFFYPHCDKDYDVHTHIEDLLNSTVYNVSTTFNLTHKFEFIALHMCDTDTIDEYELVEIFQNKSFSAFVGPLRYPVDQYLIKYALLFHRPYVSPYSPLPHHENRRIFSIGSGFEQTAVAVVTIMNHFQWKHILIIASVDENWMELGNILFIYLSTDGFLPIVKYLRKNPDDNEILDILENTEHDQKGIVLCTEFDLRIRILQHAASLYMHIHHAFFTFVMSPYVLHLEDSNVLQSTQFARILESVFEIHPDFIEEENHNERICRDGNLCTPEESFILDSLLLLDNVFNITGNKSAFENNLYAFECLRNRSLDIYSGVVFVDSKNEIMYDFIVYDYDAENMNHVKIQEVIQSKDGMWKLLGIAEVRWPSGIKLPPDECFHPEACKNQGGLDAFYILAIAVSVLLVVGVAIAIVITVWRNVIKKEMLKGHQKIVLTSHDLVFLQRKDVLKGSKMISTAAIPDKPDILKGSEKPNRSMASLHEYSDITDTARYNGDLVHVKLLKVKGFEMKNKVLNIVKTLREIRHENVNAIVGCFEDPPNSYIISDYCNRGSLMDVIKNFDIKLDWDFKVSLLTDLIRGIRFIHNSAIRYHGNLKWQNCVIDSRWVLKVTDFGLPIVYEASKCFPEYEDKDLLFTAPEHLRTPNPCLKGSEKGDVYSIAIIMQSVVLRSDPFCTCGLTTKEIINKLRHPPPLLRPSVSQQAAPPQYIQIMKICWAENPDMRPSVEEIYQQYKTITGGKKLNIVDTMFRMLEKYSTDLEDLVRERTIQLEDEKKKTDTLLYRMLPPIVADSLKIGNAVKAEHFSEVTIYFSDIVGFTTISAMSTPMEVVDLLNDLYTMFDAVIDNFDVYKVETIGDAYMVVSGLPVKNGNKHAGEIGTMALELLSHCGTFIIKHMPEVPLRVRIGLHSGSCVAGVVGLTMPRYCLFGDTVNTASRMESTGAPYRIHISEDVKTFLEVLGGYVIEYRGETELKGKGLFRTYWLTGKQGYTKKLPEPPPLNGGDTHGLSMIDQNVFVKARKISTDSVKKVDTSRSISANAPRSPTIKEKNSESNPISKAITSAVSQEASSVQPVLSIKTNSNEGTNNDILSDNGNPCDNVVNSADLQNQTKYADASSICDKEINSDLSQTQPNNRDADHNCDKKVHSDLSQNQSNNTDPGSRVSVKKDSANFSSLPKSNCSELSDMSESKVSSSAVLVSVPDGEPTTLLQTFVSSASVTAKPGHTTLVQTKTMQNHTANSVKDSEISNKKRQPNNDRYFQEIESYFKEENELPFRSNTPKTHKTKDSLKVKRSQNIQGGSTANAHQTEKAGSTGSFILYSDSTTNLTNVECTSHFAKEENLQKRKPYSKKGSKHKIYDSPVQVAEYKSISNFVMHPKPKLKERILSDIPSSSQCSPDLQSESHESISGEMNNADADKISLKLPQSESLV